MFYFSSLRKNYGLFYQRIRFRVFFYRHDLYSDFVLPEYRYYSHVDCDISARSKYYVLNSLAGRRRVLVPRGLVRCICSSISSSCEATFFALLSLHKIVFYTIFCFALNGVVDLFVDDRISKWLRNHTQ